MVSLTAPPNWEVSSPAISMGIVELCMEISISLFNQWSILQLFDKTTDTLRFPILAMSTVFRINISRDFLYKRLFVVEVWRTSEEISNGFQFRSNLSDWLLNINVWLATRWTSYYWRTKEEPPHNFKMHSAPITIFKYELNREAGSNSQLKLNSLISNPHWFQNLFSSII